MKISRRIFLMLPLLLVCLPGMASHNVSARIEYEWQSGNTWLIRVVTLSDPSAAMVDRCTIDLEIWNNVGTVKLADLTSIPRINGTLTDPNFQITCPGNIPMGDYITATVKRNVYEVTYTFPGPGYYQIYYYDISRIDNINNIPNSGSVSMYVKALIHAVTQFTPNSSPRILNDSILTACTMSPWLNELNITDPDGDSLSFALVPCMQYNPPGVTPGPVAGWVDPGTSGGGNFAVGVLGNVFWVNASNQLGPFAYALKVYEWRNGTQFGEFTYDATVFVLTNNCVVGNVPARDLVELQVFPNPAADHIRLSKAVQSMELFDLQGKALRRAEKTDRIEVGGLPGGMYVLRTVMGGEVRSFKVVIE
jgi:hypothetical protein